MGGLCTRPCTCGKKAKFKVYAPKGLITAAGDVHLQRRYYRCEHCGSTHTPWDQWTGLGRKPLESKACRLAVLAGSTWSYDEGSRNLAELCGLRISDYLISQACDRSGQQAQRWQNQAAAGAAFRNEGGATEFYTDGTSVNTRRGWREIRVGIFAKRQPGPPAKPAEWAQRKLPWPTVRFAFARLENSEHFGARWAAVARRLELKDQPVTALADGAKWIWKQVARNLPWQRCAACSTTTSGRPSGTSPRRNRQNAQLHPAKMQAPRPVARTRSLVVATVSRRGETVARSGADAGRPYGVAGSVGTCR